MTEKRFYHLALQNALISGTRQKQKLDATLGQAPKKADASKSVASTRSARLPVRVAVPAAAVLLILTIAIGTAVASHGLQTTQEQPMLPAADGTGEAIGSDTPLSETLESAIQASNTVVRLLPEFDPEHLIDQVRINHLNLPAFDEADWTWLLDVQANVAGLSLRGDCVYWTVELHVKKGAWTENPFRSAVDVRRNETHCLYPDADGNPAEDPRAQLVDLKSPGEAAYADDEDDWVMRIPFVCLLPRAELLSGNRLTVNCLMLLNDPQAAQGEEDYVMMVQVNEVTGERTYLVGSNEMLPASTIGAIELTFDFEDDALSDYLIAVQPTPEPPDAKFTFEPTPQVLYTVEPTAWPVPTDEHLFVPEATLQPTPDPAGTAAPKPSPTPEPTSAHEYTPQVYDNGQKVYDGFADTELFLAAWDTVSDELYSIRLAVDPATHAVTVTDGKRTSDDITEHIEPEPVGLQRAILMMLDPNAPQRALLLVIAVENGTFRTVVLRPEGDAIVVIKELDGECVLDGTSLVLFEETELLGDGRGWRRYSGERMTPDSDWCVCESPGSIALDHVAWLHAVRDIPCTIDGNSAVIEAGTHLYRTRFNNAQGVAEVCLQNGTIALISFDTPDAYTINGVYQAEYFEDLPLSN